MLVGQHRSARSSLQLVHSVEDDGSVEDAMAALAEVTAVVAELRRFVAECRSDPSVKAQLTPADLAQAKALLAEARGILASARRSAS